MFGEGLNNVIRSLVLTFWHRYGVRKIVGIKNGYRGLSKKFSEKVLLTPKEVESIHKEGGTILGTSRGEQSVEEMVDFLEENNVSILCTIGGDGTFKGATKISESIEKRNLKISVVGIPKVSFRLQKHKSFCNADLEFSYLIFSSFSFL